MNLFLFLLFCTQTYSHIVSYNVTMKQDTCIKDEYLEHSANNINNSIPEYIVNLDLDPIERWKHVVVNYPSDIRELIETAYTELPYLLGRSIKYIAKYYFNEIPDYMGDYGEEMKGISKYTNINLYEVILYNIFYEIFSLCTSVIVNHNNTVIHSRNLDFGIFMNGITPILKRLTISVKFMKNNKLIFQSHTFAGYIGVFTGMKPFNYSITINQRFILNGGYMGIIRWFYTKKPRWNSLIVRELLEGNYSYQDVVNKLQEVELVAPIYYIVAGINTDEGVIITRSRYESINPLYLNSSYSNSSFLIQTNHDHWNEPYYFDDRITVPTQYMTTHNRTVKDMINFLSQKPTLNTLTIFSSIMIPRDNIMYGFIQYCDDPCPSISIW